jgi:hypothetical protein
MLEMVQQQTTLLANTILLNDMLIKSSAAAAAAMATFPFAAAGSVAGVPRLMNPFFPVAATTKTTLFIFGFPCDTSPREASHILRPFPGFIGLSLRPPSTPNSRLTTGFADFASYDNAVFARRCLQGYVFDGEHQSGLQVSFAKKQSP